MPLRISNLKREKKPPHRNDRQPRNFTYWWIKQVNLSPYFVNKKPRSAEYHVDGAADMSQYDLWLGKLRNSIRDGSVVTGSKSKAPPSPSSDGGSRKHLIIIHVYNFIMKMHFSSFVAAVSLLRQRSLDCVRRQNRSYEWASRLAAPKARAPNERRDV